jgi:hypothetical protein
MMTFLGLTPNSLAIVVGAGLGLVIGGIAQYTTFCSVGAIADIVLAKDWRRLRSWVMAGAVALAGTQAAAAAAGVPVLTSLYAPARIDLVAMIVGGGAFGYGMAIAGGCLQRALVRIGAGSVKSLLTVVLMAAMAAGTLHVLGRSGLRAALAVETAAPATLDQFAATAFHLNAAICRLAVTLIVVAALLAFCLKDAWFRASRAHLWGGVLIGLTIVGGWLAWPLSLSQPRSLNLLLDLGSAVRTTWVPIAVFPVMGVATLAGIVVGSFAVALARGDLMLDRFVDGADVRRHVGGGLLMGWGGALALGCSFGQGLAGFSALSINALIAVAAMVGGCVWGVRALEAGSAWGGLKLMLGRWPKAL